MSNLSEQNRKILFSTLHQDIHDFARNAAKTVSLGRMGRLTYPPNAEFSAEEATALGSVREIPGIQSGLEKVIADAAATVFFHFFNYVDGTGDPAAADVKWTGVALVDRDETVDENQEFLHPDFFESYWAWHDGK